jgi:hypothetical protein
MTGNFATICDPHLFHYIPDVGLNPNSPDEAAILSALASFLI